MQALLRMPARTPLRLVIQVLVARKRQKVPIGVSRPLATAAHASASPERHGRRCRLGAEPRLHLRPRRQLLARSEAHTRSPRASKATPHSGSPGPRVSLTPTPLLGEFQLECHSRHHWQVRCQGVASGQPPIPSASVRSCSAVARSGTASITTWRPATGAWVLRPKQRRSPRRCATRDAHRCTLRSASRTTLVEARSNPLAA